MKCPFCELDKPYVRAGIACPHCGKLIPVPAETAEPDPETEAEPEAANDTEIPADMTGPELELETDQDIEASDPAEGLVPPDEFDPDADPDESG